MGNRGIGRHRPPTGHEGDGAVEVDEAGPAPERVERWLRRARAGSRAAVRAVGRVLRDPAHLVVYGVMLALVFLAVPLLVSGGMRLERAWSDQRRDTTVDQQWRLTTAAVTALRTGDRLDLEVRFRDRDGDVHRSIAHIEDPRRDWIRTPVSIRYDPRDPRRVELEGIERPEPIGTALVAGASIGVGAAALLVAVAMWRRRKLLVVAAQPWAVLRVPLTLAASVLALGLAAWAAGTVVLRGWSGVTDRAGTMASRVFGDLLGVAVPLFAFIAGALFSAWVARHRHAGASGGLLSRAHDLIDRAAGYVPAPDEMRASSPTPGEAPDTAPGVERVDEPAHHGAR